jgi:hypothetical protein
MVRCDNLFVRRAAPHAAAAGVWQIARSAPERVERASGPLADLLHQR